MKSILIIGKKDAGKSTTMRAVCKSLNPTKIHKLNADIENLEKSSIKLSKIEAIFNDTFIIEVKGKMILVVAGCPTEQKIEITILIEICIILKIKISFALVSMRTSERKKGFDTPTELKSKSEIVLEEWLEKIKGDDFESTVEWKSRINKIVEIVNTNI